VPEALSFPTLMCAWNRDVPYGWESARATVGGGGDGAVCAGADVAAHVENLRRDLGKRGRPRKK